MAFQWAWRGRKQVGIENFDGGVDQDLVSTGDWTKQVGTDVIREDGAGIGYSTSSGVGPTDCIYTFTRNGWGTRRISQVTINYVGFTVRAGLCNNTDSNGKHQYSAWVRNNAGTYELSGQIGYGGSPISLGLIESGFTLPTVLRIEQLDNVVLLYRDGTLKLTTTIAGILYGMGSEPGGLYYFRPALGGGGVHQAEWKNWSARAYAKK